MDTAINPSNFRYQFRNAHRKSDDPGARNENRVEWNVATFVVREYRKAQ
jgi:hypothetical protein